MPLPDGVVARMGSGRLRQPEVIGHLAFSPDGKMLITASGFPDGTVRAWDAKSAKLLWRVAIPFKGVHSYYVEVTATDMGTLVVLTGDRRGETRPVARTLSLANGKELKKTELKLPADAASNPVLSPDGKSMAVATDNGTLRLYDVNHGQETLRIAIPQTQAGIQCTWSPDSKRVAVRSVDGPSILVHDAKTGKQIAAVKQEGSYIPYADFSADGRLLVCAAGDYDKESPLTVWNLETGRALYRQMNEAW